MATRRNRRRISKKSAHDYDREADRPTAGQSGQPDRIVQLDDDASASPSDSDGTFTEEFWREQMPPHYAQRR